MALDNICKNCHAPMPTSRDPSLQFCDQECIDEFEKKREKLAKKARATKLQEI
jgi:hypothetical protein